MEIWDDLKALEGKTLSTLDQNKKFDMTSVSNEIILIHIHSTKKKRSIRSKEITSAWEKLKIERTLSRSQIEQEFAPRNPAYVVAILANLPGVRHRVKPIVLRM
jgi:hypothetical protein